MKKTERILYQDENRKVVQYTIEHEGATVTYCLKYHKEYHKSYPNGFRWVLA